MAKYVRFFFAHLSFFNSPRAQEYQALKSLLGYPLKVFNSVGFEDRAGPIASETTDAYDDHASLLGF